MSESHFYNEIKQQPQCLAELLKHPQVLPVAQALSPTAPPLTDYDLILTLARGSSDHAAAYFAYLAGQYLHLPVASVPPSLFSIYQYPLRATKTLAIGISQSGKSSDVISSIQQLKAKDTTTIAITNNPKSELARSAHHSLCQYAGVEQAVAASKTFSTQLMLLALLAAHISNHEALLNALHTIPETLHTTLTRATPSTSPLHRVVSSIQRVDKLYVLGRGMSYPIAMEWALKLKETCYIHAEAYSSAEFLHGPIASVAPQEPVIILALSDATLSSNLMVIDKLTEIGAHPIVISSQDAALQHAQQTISLDSKLHPVSESFAMLLLGQLLALYLAQAHGGDPDAPRYLHKVTRTL